MGSIPVYNKTTKAPRWSILVVGAADRNRTGTDFTPRDFKSLVSTYSTTTAYYIKMSLRHTGRNSLECRYSSTFFRLRQEHPIPVLLKISVDSRVFFVEYGKFEKIGCKFCKNDVK